MALNNLPALSSNPILRYFSFSMLYVAQGIPEGIMLFAIPAWMATNGKTAAEIGGYTAILFIPFSFKILAAPFIERYTYLAMGRRRPWILFGQTGIILSFLSITLLPDPLNELRLLTALGFVIAVFITFQDISTDALAIDIVPVEEQAKVNGLMWGAKVIGTAISLALGTWMINNYGFFIALFSLSMIVLLIMLIPLLLRERPNEKLLPWTSGNASEISTQLQLESFKKIFKSLFSVIKLSNSLLLILSIFFTVVGLSFIRTIFPIFTVQELGWSSQEYSSVFASTSLIGGILGMIAGGFMVDKFGNIKMISIYLILLIFSTSIFALSSSWWSNPSFMKGFMFIFNTLYTFVIIAIFSVVMQCCWKKISAIQFTMYMAIFNFAQTIGASLIGPLRSNFGWNYTLLCYIFFAGFSLIILQIINIKKHVVQIEKLENSDKLLSMEII